MRRSGFKPNKYSDGSWLKNRSPLKRNSSLAALKARRRLKPRPDPLLAAWGRRVRQRDGNQCRFPGMCSTGDGRIDPHHIAPRGRRPDLAYVDENGICVCRFHHDWIHANSTQAEKLGMLSTETYEKAMKVKAA